MFWLLFPDELLPAPDAEELLLPTEDVSSSYAWVIEPLSIVPLSVIPTVRFPFLAVFSLVTVVVFVSSFLFMTLKTTTTVIHAIRITETATFFILFLRDFDVICFFSLSAIFPLSFRFIIHYFRLTSFPVYCQQKLSLCMLLLKRFPMMMLFR